MKRELQSGLLLLFTVPCIGCDQTAKAVAKTLLHASDRTEFLNGIVIFEYAENRGGFLSLGAGLPDGARFLLFGLIALAGVLILLAFSLKQQEAGVAQRIGLALALSGGVGNLIDRLINYGRVVDFVSIGMGSLRTGIFNVADLQVMAGAAILFVWSIRKKGATEADASHVQ
jgi:signal peptidase II